ncbi:hypothetical protein [Serratia fonticola]|uniref:hypothetical protein n=1 Tax=Serratia fonticola TaxID=47917 RepID=UPI0024DE132B|nr:hypothetical protein [Serratia fonticola]MDK2376492.1 hypothetical protein [Serratia fonticola]
MSERAINELRNRMSVQDKVIEHLRTRSELSLHVLSAVLPTTTLSIEAVKQKIEQFRYASAVVNADALEIEKRKLLKAL